MHPPLLPSLLTNGVAVRCLPLEPDDDDVDVVAVGGARPESPVKEEGEGERLRRDLLLLHHQLDGNGAARFAAAAAAAAVLSAAVVAVPGCW